MHSVAAISMLRENEQPLLPAAHLLGLGATSMLVALCVIIELTGLAPHLWPILRGTLGAALFSTVPGFIALSYMSLFQSHRFSGLTLFLLSASLSFTFNMLFNVVIFAFPMGLPTAYGLYLGLLAALYGAYIVLLHVRESSFASRMLELARARWRRICLMALGSTYILAAAGFKSNPGLYVEELFVLRKLAELPAIEANNLSLLPDVPTTYLFVPFYLLLGLVSRFSRTDIIGAIFEIGPYFTLIAYCLILKLLLLLSSSNDRLKRMTFIGYTAIFGTLLLALPLYTSNVLTLVIPTIDRYRFASAILLPLAMFHFLIHVRDERVNIAMLVGLVYLIVEISFVHARETLFFLGFASIHLGVIALVGRARHAVRRGAAIIAIVIGVLLVYRYIALSRGEELNAYVGNMATIMRGVLEQIVADRNVAVFLGLARGLDTEIHHYESRVRDFLFGELSFLPITLYILPIYALTADNPLRLSVCGTAVAAALFSFTTGLKLVVGSIIGSWFVFQIDSFLVLLLFILFVDSIVRLSLPSAPLYFAALSRAVNPAVKKLLLLVALMVVVLLVMPAVYIELYRRGIWQESIKPFLVYFVGSTQVNSVLRGWAFLFVDATNRFVFWFAGQGILLMAAAALIYRIVLLRSQLNSASAGAIGYAGEYLRPSADVTSNRYARYVPLCFGVLLVGLPPTIISRSVAHADISLNIQKERHLSAQWCSSADVLRVYDCLNTNALIHVLISYGPPRASVPLDLLRFFRESVPQGSMVLGTDTLPIVTVAPHYAPVVTYDARLIAGFVANDFVRDAYVKPMAYARDERALDPRLRIGEYFSSELGRELLEDMIDHFKVDFVIVGPNDVHATRTGLQVRDFAKRLHIVYDRDDYLVLKVAR